MAGFLVSVDGIDGSGKSTLVQLAASTLRECGVACKVVKPLVGDGVFVGAVRSALEHSRSVAVEPTGPVDCDFLSTYFTHVLLAKAWMEIRPALLRGEVVLCDRYVWSHIANQTAFGNDVSIFSALLATLPAPDLRVVVDVPVDVALARISRRHRRGVGDSESFLASVRNSLLDAAEAAPTLILASEEQPRVYADRIVGEIKRAMK